MRHTHRFGFTLIELSIVLVIIGLIVGGVLVGQDMIKGAEIRAQLSQIDQINAAVNTFRLKYNCLPGDCARATMFFSSGSQPELVRNGNGNKIISGTWVSGADPFNWTWYSAASALAEWSSVFDHLSAAGLTELAQYDETVAGANAPGVGYPKQKVNDRITTAALAMPGGVAVGYDVGNMHIIPGHKIRLGACTYHPSYPGFGCNISTLTGFAIDSKIDDGKPYSGATVITGPYNYVYRVPGTAQNDTTTCGDAVTNTYRVTSKAGGCAVTINASF
jgi:prepilin-type N-terminal cleavage/methylation domain-containing protein